MIRTLAPIVIIALCVASCSTPQTESPAGVTSADTPAASTPTPEPAPAPGAIVHGDSSTNLNTTPISAADVALYNAIMGGASAMLSALSQEDREALALAARVDKGEATATPATQRLLDRARALQHADEELARLQGIDARYREVKSTIEAVIGPRAQPASADSAVAKENRRYLEVHRQRIERLQGILRDPLSRPPAPPLSVE